MAYCRPDAGSVALEVLTLSPNGLVDWWNRGCLGRAGNARDAVRKGDLIVVVNEVTGSAERMAAALRAAPPVVRIIFERPSVAAAASTLEAVTT
mmetsp:Transcript_11641/g.41542  ORF Transcript_11641/g.41542 Transcript_11641/m.41542 type:complete len:94 (+) Transcript_11641:440-721(+)